jgi:hypothetical protein
VKNDDLNLYEFEVLELLSGNRPNATIGAETFAVLAFLKGRRLVRLVRTSAALRYEITAEGIEVRDWRRANADPAPPDAPAPGSGDPSG